MKKFKFTLEPVLRYKSMMERQKLQELALIRAEIEELENKRDQIIKRKHWAMEDFKSKVSTGVKPPSIKNYIDYFARLSEDIERVAQEILRKEKEEERVIEEIVVLRREKKSMEILKERRYEEYLIELKRYEDKQLDELVSYKESVKSM